MFHRLSVFLFLLSLCLFGCQKAAEQTAPESESESESETKSETESHSHSESTPGDPPSPQRVDAQETDGNVAPTTNNGANDPIDDPSLDLYGLLEKGGVHLPDDAFLLTVIDFDAALNATVAVGIDANALKGDLSAHFMNHMGVDPTGAEWAVLAVGESRWGAAIIGGTIDISGLADSDIPGVKSLRGGEALVFQHDGVTAFVPNRYSIDRIKGDGPRLAGSERHAALAAALREVPEGPVMGVMQRSESLMFQGLAVELPVSMRTLETAALSFKGGIHFAVTGDQDTIQAIEQAWGGVEDMTLREIDRVYDRRADLGLNEGFGAILGKHLVPGLFKTYAPSFEERKASVFIEMDMSGSSAVMTIGILAAIVVPAFTEYLLENKKSEARIHLRTIAEAALAHAAEKRGDLEGTVSVGAFPKATAPLCTAAGTAGNKVAPASTDWSQWAVLRFRIDKPHFFRYCYQSSEDQTSFATWAEATTSAGETTRHCLKGHVEAGGAPILDKLETTTDTVCAP